MTIAESRSLWNRRQLDLASDEVLAQLLDRGEISVWRELYRMAREDAGLRKRILQTVLSVPLPLPHLWLAALASLGEDVDFDAPLPNSATSSI
jgi:hypothetical protein